MNKVRSLAGGVVLLLWAGSLLVSVVLRDFGPVVLGTFVFSLAAWALADDDVYGAKGSRRN